MDLRSSPLTTMGRFLFFGKRIVSMQRSRKPSRQLSFALFLVKLIPLAFSISASFSAFFLSNSACLQFSSCAFRNNLMKFRRVAVTVIVKPATISQLEHYKKVKRTSHYFSQVITLVHIVKNLHRADGILFYVF